MQWNRKEIEVNIGKGKNNACRASKTVRTTNIIFLKIGKKEINMKEVGIGVLLRKGVLFRNNWAKQEILELSHNWN